MSIVCEIKSSTSPEFSFRYIAKQAPQAVLCAAEGALRAAANVVWKLESKAVIHLIQNCVLLCWPSYIMKVIQDLKCC